MNVDREPMHVLQSKQMLSELCAPPVRLGDSDPFGSPDGLRGGVVGSCCGANWGTPEVMRCPLTLCSAGGGLGSPAGPVLVGGGTAAGVGEAFESGGADVLLRGPA